MSIKRHKNRYFIGTVPSKVKYTKCHLDGRVHVQESDGAKEEFFQRATEMAGADGRKTSKVHTRTGGARSAKK